MPMQALLLVGPTTTTTPISSRSRHRRWTPLIVAAAAAAASSSSSSQNHYAVLGLNLSATPADIKRAYRLLARKYHPDVSKDSQAPEVFKSIRLAYEVLSNETTRARYDQALKFREYTGRQYRRQRNDNPEFDSGPRIYRWDELRQRMQHEGYWEHNNSKEESSSFTKTKGASQGENQVHEMGSFSEVLRSSFISLFLLQTFGSRLSLTFSSLMALFDRKLDAGYKMGYVIAWILGGRAGILLTLCLTFASWACGKTSSSIVALVVVAMWVGTNLARFAPLPQGALLTLLYMSIKLQVDLN
ncbi:chaperone protein dnaJ 20, chloroplastic [Morus notabilis]|uniref:chaperone protein dnaJ 20, chloroplastic n=1 Tax=Morus notabilis TaxID=981085 RepID=UPI000CED40FA|nr:chaperone protein dnaJ 20, chloroplastic [Morus notabilis]